MHRVGAAQMPLASKSGSVWDKAQGPGSEGEPPGWQGGMGGRNSRWYWHRLVWPHMKRGRVARWMGALAVWAKGRGGKTGSAQWH